MWMIRPFVFKSYYGTCIYMILCSAIYIDIYLYSIMSSTLKMSFTSISIICSTSNIYVTSIPIQIKPFTKIFCYRQSRPKIESTMTFLPNFSNPPDISFLIYFFFFFFWISFFSPSLPFSVYIMFFLFFFFFLSFHCSVFIIIIIFFIFLFFFVQKFCWSYQQNFNPSEIVKGTLNDQY